MFIHSHQVCGRYMFHFLFYNSDSSLSVSKFQLCHAPLGFVFTSVLISSRMFFWHSGVVSLRTVLLTFILISFPGAYWVLSDLGVYLLPLSFVSLRLLQTSIYFFSLLRKICWPPYFDSLVLLAKIQEQDKYRYSCK